MTYAAERFVLATGAVELLVIYLLVRYGRRCWWATSSSACSCSLHTLYSLRKQFERGISLFSSASLGSLRAAVIALHERGLVTAVDSIENGRSKKTYSITDAGRAAFLAWMLEPIRGDVETVALSRPFFLGLLEAEDRARPDNDRGPHCPGRGRTPPGRHGTRLPHDSGGVPHPVPLSAARARVSACERTGRRGTSSPPYANRRSRLRESAATDPWIGSAGAPWTCGDDGGGCCGDRTHVRHCPLGATPPHPPI